MLNDNRKKIRKSGGEALPYKELDVQLSKVPSELSFQERTNTKKMYTDDRICE